MARFLFGTATQESSRRRIDFFFTKAVTSSSLTQPFSRNEPMPSLRSMCLLPLFLAVLSSSSAQAGEHPWTEVRSPNFRVLTNGSAGEGRRVAREFEQMRAASALAFPKMRLETGAPLTIFAPRDESSMKAMAPGFWKAPGPKPAGLFQHGWERQYATIRLDQDIPGRYNVVYHEYVHSLLHANFRWLPTWLDEGLAEFYGNTRFEESKIYLGAPSARVHRLQGVTLIKLDELISENPWRKFRNDEQQIDLYYSEAWALVHYLTFGPGMEQGAKLNKFYSSLLLGEDQKKAFQEAFGNFKDVEDGLVRYTRQFMFSSYVAQNPPQLKEKEFPFRVTTQAETDAELAAYRLFSHDRDEARSAIEQALRGDPNLALAHETLGFLNFADGKDQDAESEFAKSYTADPQRYLSLYYKTMLSPARTSATPADELLVRSAMYDVLKANPRFAPAFIELALIASRHADFQTALNLARKAEALEPSRAGYHLLAGRLFLALGNGQEAGKQATFVADRWRGPDRDEAMELWNDIPAEKRPSDAPQPLDTPPTTLSSQGTLVSVVCGGKENGTSLVIQSPVGTQTFRSSGAHVIGYSDTLWFGTDHFTLCHHLEGLRAIVVFKPSSGKDFIGEWLELELREDLPTLSAKETAPAAAPAKESVAPAAPKN
jgi:tetratricopeptide (TPR) repeat protein